MNSDKPSATQPDGEADEEAARTSEAQTASGGNLSTENQPKGSARNLSDTLDRAHEPVTPGQRQWSDDSETKPDQ